MKSKWGRTGRKRKRKGPSGTKSYAANRSHEWQYIQLQRWLKGRGFQGRHLRAAEFADTGRGLMATRDLKPGELIIALPETCLITTETVLQSYLGKYIRLWRPHVSPLLALCTFLVAERFAGERSQWKPYLDVIPSTYSCPVYWELEIVHLLPAPLRKKALEQKTEVQELHTESLAFFSSLQPLFCDNVADIYTYDALRWAWCTVNTRTVYMKHTQQDRLLAQQDVCALAPYLDLLNHSPEVQVEAEFSKDRRCYEIRTNSGCRKHDQAFICYGPHDNQRLLLEYGFVAANNPHRSVYVTKDTILAHLSPGDKQMPKKWALLKEHDFLVNLTFGIEGPSWKLLTALKLLCLRPEEFTSWKKVILGSFISDANEQDSRELVRKICFHLLDETSCALKEISLVRSKKISDADAAVHLALVESLRLEEKKILEISANLLQNEPSAGPTGAAGSCSFTEQK
ncbi:SET domain containing 4 L homeolog isoform X1 [Xenopus laevis]|uniref:SET domain-containing protein 4 n=2 Tax=Xenopus laevis TaxID=8355 RepID=A0A1L8HCE9_XENLA|nr:SET domain containing 4 L homeolog isoform X1 [Xenopus laevis]XP_041436776.1 SET domain containing 4 L homeolog isoform X1 [Xenopus laevis]OCT93790.1 hypothetical protein XELAEV_18011462mg [Xenopus laevis]